MGFLKPDLPVVDLAEWSKELGRKRSVRWQNTGPR